MILPSLLDHLHDLDATAGTLEQLAEVALIRQQDIKMGESLMPLGRQLRRTKEALRPAIIEAEDRGYSRDEAALAQRARQMADGGKVTKLRPGQMRGDHPDAE